MLEGHVAAQVVIDFLSEGMEGAGPITFSGDFAAEAEVGLISGPQ